jgi:hypothetical protein
MDVNRIGLCLVLQSNFWKRDLEKKPESEACHMSHLKIRDVIRTKKRRRIHQILQRVGGPGIIARRLSEINLLIDGF